MISQRVGDRRGWGRGEGGTIRELARIVFFHNKYLKLRRDERDNKRIIMRNFFIMYL